MTKENMGPKKRPSASSSSPILGTSPQMKFRPIVETARSAAKGTKPLPEPSSVPEIFTKLLVHVCKKVVFIKPVYRIVGYGILLFFVSLVSDYVPLPRTYFSSSGNILNQYFVKLSWMWTLSLVGIFVGLTSSVYCCGNGPLISRHLVRLIIATLVWFIWTSLFQTIEETTGQCLYTPVASAQQPTILLSKGRRHCLKNGGKWTSLDISGHSFILIWCTLFITEECKAILGWDTISDFIRNEDYRRGSMTRRNSDFAPQSTKIASEDDTPVSHLTFDEFETLKKLYSKFGIWAKVVLVALTMLTILWDIMLAATACYFHIMIEKVLAGIIAIFMWLCTYRGLYAWNSSLSPGLPGDGLFKYLPSASTASSSISEQKATAIGKAASKTANKPVVAQVQEEVPTFLGMPLYSSPPRRNKGKDFGLSSSSLDVTSMRK